MILCPGTTCGRRPLAVPRSLTTVAPRPERRQIYLMGTFSSRHAIIRAFSLLLRDAPTIIKIV